MEKSLANISLCSINIAYKPLWAPIVSCAGRDCLGIVSIETASSVSSTSDNYPILTANESMFRANFFCDQSDRQPDSVQHSGALGGYVDVLWYGDPKNVLIK